METMVLEKRKALWVVGVWLILESAFLFGWGVLVYSESRRFSWLPASVVLQCLLFAPGVALAVLFWKMTNGYLRVSEVGARFRFDGLPGKMLALDTMRAIGYITDAAHESGRQKLHVDAERASNFWGYTRLGRHGVRGVMILILLGFADACLRGLPGTDWRPALLLLTWAMALAQGIHVGLMAILAKRSKILDLDS